MATYLSPDVEFAYVENVALHNLGTGCWAPLAQGGLLWAALDRLRA